MDSSVEAPETIEISEYDGLDFTGRLLPVELDEFTRLGVSFFVNKRPLTSQLIVVRNQANGQTVCFVVKVEQCIEGYWSDKHQFFVRTRILRRIQPQN